MKGVRTLEHPIAGTMAEAEFSTEDRRTNPERLNSSRSLLADRLQALWSGSDVLLLDCRDGDELDAIGKWASTIVGVGFGPVRRPRMHRFLRGAPGRLPVKSASIDVVTTFGAGEWLLHQPEARKEVFRVLRPEGTFCIVIDTDGDPKLVAEAIEAHAVRSTTVDVSIAQNGSGVPGTYRVLLARNGSLAALVTRLATPAPIGASLGPTTAPLELRSRRTKSRKASVVVDVTTTAPSPSDAEVSIVAEASVPTVESLRDENARLLERALTERSRAEAAQTSLTQWRELNSRLQHQMEAAEMRNEQEARMRSDLAQVALDQWRQATEALERQLESERGQYRALMEQVEARRREGVASVEAANTAAQLAAIEVENLRNKASDTEAAFSRRLAELEAQFLRDRREIELKTIAAAEFSFAQQRSELEQRAAAAESEFQQHRIQLERRVGELEATPPPAPPLPVRPAGSAALQIAGEYMSLRGEVISKRWAAWVGKRHVKTRGARFTRHAMTRRLLQRFSAGRALILWSSALCVPQDGPGRRGVLQYASRKPGAPDPHPLFSSKYYASWAPDVAASGTLEAIHYLVIGDHEGRAPHPLFDSLWYRETHGDKLRHWPLTTLEHYLAIGAKEGLRPHVLFDPYHYVTQCQNLDDNGREPLTHYLTIGWREDLDPHPLFDNAFYLERNPDVLREGVPPLLHYVSTGWSEGRDPHPLFSSRYYLSQNPDVEALGMNPLVHYVMQGWREGRKPHPCFEPAWYLEHNPDVAQAGVEPLTHYLTRGAWEARPVTQTFDPAVFTALYPEEIVAGRTPLEAWARLGFPDAGNSPPDDGRALQVGSAKQTGSFLFDQLALGKLGTNDPYSWQSYLALTSAITNVERQRIEKLTLKAPKLIDISEDEVARTATKLAFQRVANPDVTILVPAFNQVKVTVECLASLAAAKSKLSIEVIVVDDASTDQTQPILSLIPGLVYIRNESNLGFLRSVNAAAKRASGEYLVVLNNDTQVKDDWLDPLVESLQDKTVGVVAPKFVFPNGRLQEAGARLSPDGSSHMIGLFDDPALPRYNYARDVDYASGACLAMRRALFDKLDGFDEKFAPAYCEDVDFCLRVRESGMRIRYEPASVVYHHLSKSSDALPGSFKMRQIRRNQQKLVERWGDLIAEMNKVRVIAFYLPQFHQIPENDRWWGAGFTEWRNVHKALPNFVGHYQPHQPAELGNYDLSNVEVMERQADLARAHGVDAFCYYYYSFSGRRILDMPLERMLESNRPDLPFCVCWANENWTRKWDGGDQAVLLSQRYAPEDDETIIRDLVRYLRAPNYVRVNGLPFLAVYRPQLLPDANRTAATWRRVCREEGLGEIHLAMVEVFEHARTHPNPADWGFDSTIEFPPSGMSHPAPPAGAQLNPRFKGVVSDYRQVVQNFMKEPIPGHLRFRGAMPSWDNTPRRQDDPFCFVNATPGAFQAWLEAIIAQTKDQNAGDERIIFINAWNEWAEGAHLEPDERFGRGWLDAVRNAQEPDHVLTSRRNAKAW